MRGYYCNCEVCGKEFVAKRYPHTFYCSNKCKQKAYRSRKLAKANSELQTVSLETWNQRQIVLGYDPSLTEETDQFFVDFGKDAYSRLVWMLHRLIPYDARLEVIESQKSTSGDEIPF